LFPANSGEIAYAALAQFVPTVREAKIDLAKTFDNRFVEKDDELAGGRSARLTRCGRVAPAPGRARRPA
jgi:hypothetical protein